MNNTALGAENKKKQRINFISEAHEKFYYEKLKEVRYQDVYHKAFCYCTGGNRIQGKDEVWKFFNLPELISLFKESADIQTPDMQKYEQNKPLDKEQFAITIGGKAYTDKKEAELGEKLDRLTALNTLLNMDEKGNDAIGMDEETQEAEPALLKEKLSEMKASVSGTPAGGDAVDKTRGKDEVI